MSIVDPRSIGVKPEQPPAEDPSPMDRFFLAAAELCLVLIDYIEEADEDLDGETRQ